MTTGFAALLEVQVFFYVWGAMWWYTGGSFFVTDRPHAENVTCRIRDVTPRDTSKAKQKSIFY